MLLKKTVQTIVISPANLLFQIKSLECSTIRNKECNFFLPEKNCIYILCLELGISCFKNIFTISHSNSKRIILLQKKNEVRK